MPTQTPHTLAELAHSIDAMLTDRQIHHRTLVEGPRGNLNLSLTDHSSVFIKVSRPGERSGRAASEIDGAVWARAHGLRVPKARIRQVLNTTGPDGGIHDVTVWKWYDPATAPALRDQMTAMADLVATVATTPAPPFCREFDLDFFVDRMHERLDGSHDPRAQRLLTEGDAAARTIRNRLDPTRYRWIHGDTHFGNILWLVSGRPLLIDWESNVRGPVEFDLAQIIRSVHLHFPTHATAEKNRALRTFSTRINESLRVDWDLVDAAIRFRCASAGSHLLMHNLRPAELTGNLNMLNDAQTPRGAAAAA